MKQTTEIVLRKRLAGYVTLAGDEALCKSFVSCLLGGLPDTVRVKVRARKPGLTQGRFKVGRRDAEISNYHSVGRELPRYAYPLVDSTLESIGVKKGQKFWFRITAIYEQHH